MSAQPAAKCGQDGSVVFGVLDAAQQIEHFVQCGRRAAGGPTDARREESEGAQARRRHVPLDHGAGVAASQEIAQQRHTGLEENRHMPRAATERRAVVGGPLDADVRVVGRPRPPSAERAVP